MSETTKPKVRVITPEGILSYPHLDAPQKAEEGKKAKFSATIIFPAGTDLTALKAAAAQAVVEKYGPTKAAELLKPDSSFKKPFRTDVSEKGYPEGSTFINARSDNKPGAVYNRAIPGTKTPEQIPVDKVKEELYPGAKVRASVTAFTYDNNGNRGVSFALNNVQKLGDGTRLDSRVAAEDEFDADLSAAPADLSSLI